LIALILIDIRKMKKGVNQNLISKNIKIVPRLKEAV
jgi:hypothetical protein